MVRNRNGVALIEQARRLRDVLQKVLAKLGLALGLPKCESFVILLQGGAMGLFKRSDPTTRWMQTREEARHRALRRLPNKTLQGITKDLQMPFLGVHSIKLLGLKLDSQWSFHQRMEGMQNKPRIRSGMMAKVGNSKWGLGNRVLTTTAHA